MRVAALATGWGGGSSTVGGRTLVSFGAVKYTKMQKYCPFS